MRSALGVAVLAVLACAASGAFRGQFADLFNTWDPAHDVRYVKDFDHYAPRPEVYKEEHSRKKRNADEAARFAAGNPITKACDRPGYTGQYCEFPICQEFNPVPNPEQYQTNDGYVIDLTDLGNCTRKHEIIVDETMFDIRIEVQSLENVNPELVIYDSDGYIGTPEVTVKEDDRFVAQFAYLKPGYYTLQPSASSLNSRCILQTTAQTFMTISGGFSTDDRDRNDFPTENAAAHQFNSIMLHLNGARSPAEMKTVSVIGPENQVFRPRILDKRYGCQYEFYFDSLFCSKTGQYAMIVEGVDFFGLPFRRTAPFLCAYKPQPPTSPAPTTAPVPTNPNSCANGGVLLESGGKTTCICQDHWTGYDCSQPLCINGGTLIQNKCFCTSGFEGPHCEMVKCEPNSNHGFGVDKPTLVFVVRVREEMNGVMQQVQQAIDEVVSNLQTFDPAYLSRFTVVFFNDYTNFYSKHFTSIEAFDTEFYKATISTNEEGGCTDAVLGAITTGLLNLGMTQGSTIYVITDALADDYDTGLEALMQFNSYWRATINFVYVEPTAESKCESDLSDPGFRSFDEIAARFGGMAWHVDDRSKVYDTLYGHMNSIIYKSQLMLTLDRDECGNGLGKVIQLSKDTDTLVFIAKGRDFTLEIIAPDGSSLQPDSIVDQGLFTIKRTADPIAGAYMIRTHTKAPTASCSVRAYQAAYQSYSRDSPVEAFWGISTDVDVDAIFYQPLVGMDNHPVFHIENYGDSEDYDHAFAFLNMYAVREGVEREVYASNGLFRGGCSFHFYFPSFRCRPNENLHYEFNLRTEEGFYIQRGGVMTCFNYIPTLAPPTDCQNGGVMYNETCLCQPHYEGDHCESVICENGGTAYFGICQCAPGWIGPFCMFPQCSESGPVPNYGFHVDMAFIVEVTKSGVGQIQQLMTTLPEIIRDINSQHPDWIDRLVLIGYDSDKVIGMVDTPMDNTQKFFDTLNKWGNSNPTDDGCIVKIWPAVDQLLNGRMDGPNQRVLPDRSVINIFETGQPSDLANTVNLITVSEELLERKTITNVFQMKDPATGGWRCNGKNDDFVYIEQLARRGDGKMYTIGNGDIGRAVRMIPTLFSSAIVYKYHTEDCTMGHNIYFPVDAYTQTVTAVVAGYQALVQLNRYDATPFTADGRIDILNDDMNQVVEFRNPCDSDWDSISQYCMYFNSALVKNFVAGNELCQKMGGFLADDLSTDKNNWLKNAMAGQKAWLGLTLVNGVWYFQHDGGTTQAVPANINFWNGGQAPTNTASGTCAYFYQGLWYQAQCDEKHLVVCQKHMFDSNNEPSDLGDDDLSPGKYYLFVQTALEGSSWKGCDVEVRVQSDLQVAFGFVDGLRKDTPHPVANIDSDQNRVVSSIAIGKEETQTSILQHVQLRSDDTSSLLLEAATYSYRFACSYDYVSQPLSCEQTNGEDFSVVMIGEDDTGNTFQRYSTSLCYKWYICFNGGVYSNGQCLCPDYFTGDDCRTPMCQNGGTPATSGKKCHCTSGFGGDACQFVQCDADSGATFSNDGKAMIFVVEKSQNTADAIQKIADNWHIIQQAAWDTHQDWFKFFMLTTFTVDGQMEDLALYYDYDDLGAHLSQVAKEAKDYPGACQGPIWSALGNLFANPLFNTYLNGAEVMLVSAAAPLDADLDAIHTTMEMFDTHTPVIDYIHVETPQCQVDDWIKGLSNFANFLSTTGGMLFRVDPATAGDALEAFLPSRYAPQRLSYSDPLNCQTNEIYVQIDNGMTQFVYVAVSGKGAKISVETPQQTPIEQSLALWESDYQSFWRIYPKYPGIYKVTVDSQNRACFPVVWGNGGAQVFFGFIQDYNYVDTPKPYAVFGAVNFPVFYLFDSKTGAASETESLYMAHMERQSIGGDYEVPYDSDIDQRVGCSYNYIGKGFTCLQENDVITLSASGVDAYNQPFTRQSTSYCKKDGYYTTTTKTPKTTGTVPTVPTTTALTPATLNFDILFIIDETEDEAFIRSTAEPFIEKTMSIYTTTQRFARVGLITMPKGQNKSMPVAFLSSVDSFEALDENLISLEDFAIPDANNEYLTQALQFANDPNKYRKEEHGYRNGISNHLIVILTAKNQFTDTAKAIGEIQKIAEAQSYGVIAVGYGDKNKDWSDLTSIAGSDCMSLATDSASLLDQTTVFIQNKIWDAAFNGGRYCAPANIAMSNINH